MRMLVIRLVTMQALAGLVVAVGFFVWAGAPAAVAAVYGAATALAISLLLAFRISRAARPGAGLAGLYLAAAERMVLVLAAFAGGIAALGLMPVPLIAGFAGAQLMYWMAAGPLKRYMLETVGGVTHGE